MKNSVTRAKKGDGRRPRISVSLTEEDYAWIEAMAGKSESLSSALSRLITSARQASFRIDEQKSADRFEQFSHFLAAKKRSKLAQDLNVLLAEFIESQ